jgi:succinyl-diaminopimelate desuccinylase
MNAPELTRRLIAFNTTNPPGNELPCAQFLEELLRAAGFHTEICTFEPNRGNVIARLAGTEAEAPLVLSGHLDTVPPGNAAWSSGAFAGEIRDGKLYGRGSSDMKSGVAAIVTAALEIAASGGLKRGLVLLLTGGEEVGCAGARHMVADGLSIPGASALLVAEPTSNYPAVGHKGALYMKARTTGVTAHSSMPERGVNAIYKAARAIAKIETFRFEERHTLLGTPTINVGMMSGGMNVNSVPDEATFTIDVRSVASQSHAGVLAQLRDLLGPDVELTQFVDMTPVATDPADPFVRCVFEIMQDVLQKSLEPFALPYFSDASVLQSALNCPAVLLGPGEAAQAHQTDEYCFVERIQQASDAIVRIARAWDSGL